MTTLLLQVILNKLVPLTCLTYYFETISQSHMTNIGKDNRSSSKAFIFKHSIHDNIWLTWKIINKFKNVNVRRLRLHLS